MKTNTPLRYALVGISVLIFMTMVLTRCTSEAPALGSEPAAPEPLAPVIAAAEDPGLVLFRHPHTRERVLSFYAAETRSPEIARAILTEAEVHDIPVALAFSLAWAESRYQVRAINHNASSIDRGLFQLNSASFPFLKAEQFYDPLINAKYGLSHLRFCLDEAGNEIVGLAMYNAGTQGVRRGTPLSTLHHVSAVIEYRESLEERFAAEVLHPLPKGDSVAALDS